MAGLSREDILLVSRPYLITLTTVQGAIYGFIFALYILCARSVYLQLKDRERHRQHVFTLSYMSFAMAILLFTIAVDAQDAATSYVDHADYPEGGYGYSGTVFRKYSVALVRDAALILLNLMMFGFQIWRLKTVLKGLPYSLLIVVLLVLALLTSLAFEAAYTVIIAQSEASLRLSEMLYRGRVASQLSVSTIVTVSIIGRIAAVRIRNMRIMGQAHIAGPYTSVLSIFIESFVIEFVWMAVGLGGYFSHNRPSTSAVNNFINVTNPFIEVFAYLLVVHRVSTGQGWKDDTAEKLGTLRRDQDGLQTSQIGTRASIPITHEHT